MEISQDTVRSTIEPTPQGRSKSLPLPLSRLQTFNHVKSPLNYTGGKFKLLNQILPLFPKGINSFVDLFAGGCNVGVNVRTNQVVCNDNLSYLIDLYQCLQSNSVQNIINHIESRIRTFGLSLTNEQGFKELRDLYNKDRNDLDLFVLTAYSFNHQIRFNNSHEFNNPFGRDRSSFNDSMRANLMAFVNRIHQLNISFSCKSFEEYDFSNLTSDDFVYCDPPYLISTGTYNDGKRGFKGWGNEQEIALLESLDILDKQGIRFGLSNVLEHKGKSNDILKDWVSKKNYDVTRLAMNYSNSSYQTINRDKNSSIEVLITNYPPTVLQTTLF